MRLSQVARKLNVGTDSIVEHLKNKGFDVENKPNTKITPEQFSVLEKEFSNSASDKVEASEIEIGESYSKNSPKPAASKPAPKIKSASEQAPKLLGPKKLGKISIDKPKPKVSPVERKEEVVEITNQEPKEGKPTSQKPEEVPEPTPDNTTKPLDKVSIEVEDLKGLTVVGKMSLPEKPKIKEKDKSKFLQVASSDKKNSLPKKERRRISSDKPTRTRDRSRSRSKTTEISDKEIQEHIKATLAKLSKNKRPDSNRTKYRKEKRTAIAEKREQELKERAKKANVLKVTEFISAKDLASVMDVRVDEVLAKCLELGIMVSINQRLDSETVQIIADEFGFQIEFTNQTHEEEDQVELDKPEDMEPRAPIVTIMGHVDHGKTSLLDYIRNSNIIKTEAGGITQHIGAYDVTTEEGKQITFLDTPGHEAFTAMRARGTQITDIAVIVVAADDSVMPQTKEAINHAQLANVPILIAINKVDRAQSTPEKIKEQLSQNNILVEDWGGKYQCQELSAKTGQGVNELLEKILLEAELLELKANPNKNAVGTVIEASLDQGRGYLATLMIQAGTLKVGDIVLAGSYFGKIKAMFDHQGKKIKTAGPSKPAQILGLNGAPQSGDKIRVMGSDKEAREIAQRRQQLLREQMVRSRKHITLEEVGKRLAMGDFRELNIIIKGDVDGSVEALADSLLKLTTERIQINIIQKSVGAISDSDILLASASDAIIIGFQVRPTSTAKKLAEKENIDIRLYSVIYDAINHVKEAIEGMSVEKMEEVITGNADVREIFKISKVGTIAGTYVTDGIIKRNNNIRIIREGIVHYSGTIKQLKRFKNDITEAKAGYECGISIENFNDIKVGDVIEAYEEQAV